MRSSQLKLTNTYKLQYNDTFVETKKKRKHHNTSAIFLRSKILFQCYSFLVRLHVLWSKKVNSRLCQIINFVPVFESCIFSSCYLLLVCVCVWVSTKFEIFSFAVTIKTELVDTRQHLIIEQNLAVSWKLWRPYQECRCYILAWNKHNRKHRFRN